MEEQTQERRRHGMKLGQSMRTLAARLRRLLPLAGIAIIAVEIYKQAVPPDQVLVLALGLILIYVGAISVLMLFAILLTPRSARDNAPVPYAAPLGALAGLIGAVIIFVAVRTDY